MTTFLFIILNLSLIIVFLRIVAKKNFLSIFDGGRWWLTFLAIGIITLMDELTSIYYAPFEAYRFIGFKSIFYIAITSLLIRYLTLRFIEISEILEVNNIKGGGVYSFSYLVLGPTMSFVAVASILVDYVLTATISTVSAVENGTTFLGIGANVKYIFMFLVVWFIAFLNILGIRESAKFTFGIFVFAGFVLLNLILGGILNFDIQTKEIVSSSFSQFVGDFNTGSIFSSYSNIITGIGSCILAYSGVESVLQTASLTKSWKDIKKAYIFLGFTVGIVTPLIALFALSSKVSIGSHETDLIPAFANSVNGKYFGLVVSVLASLTLIMAVNTAMVASAELIEKIAEKYNYKWLIRFNKRQSLYRVHIFNAVFYSLILIVTSGSQAILAEMYAVGLVASFCINTGSLLKYRYSKGSTKISSARSRIGTLILFIILLSTFAYIVFHRPYGTLLWFIITLIILALGIKISKSRSPEIKLKKLTKTPMDIVFAIADVDSNDVHVHFRRPREIEDEAQSKNSIYVSFFSPRTEQPEIEHPNHFSLSIEERWSLHDMISGLIKSIEYDVPSEKKIHFHFGWPLSSWIDRMSIGVMVFNIIRLPKKFPKYSFHLDYFSNK